MVDFEGHKFGCKLTRVCLDSLLNRIAYLLLSRLHIIYWTIINELTARYAQNYTPLKIPTYPTHPKYYSRVIKFNVLGLSKFRSFFIRFYWKRLRAYTNDILCINYACIMCLLYCASDVNVIFKTFLITWQQLSCHDLHQSVIPTWMPVYEVNISKESVHKSNLRRCFLKKSHKMM